MRLVATNFLAVKSWSLRFVLFFFPFDLQEYNLSEFVGVCIELSIKSRLRQ